MRRLAAGIAALAACGEHGGTAPPGGSESSGGTPPPPSGSSSDDGSSTGADATSGGSSSSVGTSDGAESSSDDGSSSSSDGSSSSTTAAVNDTCGDGTRDPGEACDDGNTFDGDACSARCELLFEIEWTVSHDGGVGQHDEALAVVIAGETIVVLGSETVVADGPPRLWLATYDGDGVPGWTFTSQGPEGLAAAGSALAILADGDFVLAGRTVLAGSGSDVLVMRVDADTQAIAWTQTFDGAGSEPGSSAGDGARAVAIDLDGGVVVAGSVMVDGEGSDAWAARIAPDDGQPVGTWTWNGGAGINEHATTIVVRPDGMVEIIALEIEPTGIGSRVLLLDGDALTPDPGVDLEGAAVGDVVMLGSGERLTAGRSPVGALAAARVDMSWGAQWIVWGPAGAGYGIAHDDLDRVYVVGSELVGASERAWLGGIDAAGQLAWSDAYAGAGEDPTYWTDVAVDAVGDVIVVGVESTATEGTNAIVRKVHPL